MRDITVDEIKEKLASAINIAIDNAIDELLNEDDEDSNINVDNNITVDKTDIMAEKILSAKVGDKITIEMPDGSNLDVYIAGIDTEERIKCHHIACIANFGDSKMGNSALHGYAGAKDMQNFLDEKAEMLKEVFGLHLIYRQVNLSSAINDDPDNEGEFIVSDYVTQIKCLTLLSEVEVFGKKHYSDEHNIHNKKYPIFEDTNINNLLNHTAVWLRDVGSATTFCYSYSCGHAGRANANYPYAAVALFCIG